MFKQNVYDEVDSVALVSGAVTADDCIVVISGAANDAEAVKTGNVVVASGFTATVAGATTFMPARLFARPSMLDVVPPTPFTVTPALAPPTAAAVVYVDGRLYAGNDGENVNGIGSVPGANGMVPGAEGM
jgi:hypothetical protein